MLPEEAMVRRGQEIGSLVLMCVQQATSHGWITTPVSRLEMGKHHWSSGMPNTNLRWSPQSCNGPNSCGDYGGSYTESKDHWLPFYELAGVPVPTYAPGSDIDVSITITADHGGQSWMMISCADSITEEGPWTFMQRAADDRDHHFMPSNPAIYAWPKNELITKYGATLRAKWTMPSDFSCPSGRGVGRWLWKTGNSCNDDSNMADKKTEAFALSEFDVLNRAFGQDTMRSCNGANPEWFINCFDFSDGSAPTPPAPPPTPPHPQCCWSAWGAVDGCGRYPSSGGGAGLCNTDWTKSCRGAGDCVVRSISV